MSASVLHLPQPIRLRAVRQIITERGQAVGATGVALRQAQATALTEMQQGRSAATALACAMKTLRTPRTQAEAQ